jgi:hypothetical protein
MLYQLMLDNNTPEKVFWLDAGIAGCICHCINSAPPEKVFRLDAGDTCITSVELDNRLAMISAC